jgi:flagellar biosynthesis component FlhA
MDKWFEDLYSRNKILFWFLLIFGLPFVVLFLFRDLILKIIVQKSNEELVESKTKDASLSEKERIAKESAESSKKKADSIEKEIDSIKTNEDWNKKRGEKGEIGNLGLLMVVFAVGVSYCLIRALF